MRVSELIAKLQVLKNMYGDVKVSCGHHCVDRHEEPQEPEYLPLDGDYSLEPIIRIPVDQVMSYRSFVMDDEEKADLLADEMTR